MTLNLHYQYDERSVKTMVKLPALSPSGLCAA